MPEVQYIDPIMKKYGDLITANTTNFKRIYYGDPVRIGNSELPALVIVKSSTQVANSSNMVDKHNVRLILTVITDVRNTISDDRDLVPGVNSLYNIIEGRSADDYTLKSESLLGILRHNVTLDAGKNLHTDIDSVTEVEYGMTMGKREPGAWSIEGTVTLTANFYQNR